MAMSKIDRIDREIEKTRGKIIEYQNRLKELEACGQCGGGSGRSPAHRTGKL